MRQSHWVERRLGEEMLHAHGEHIDTVFSLRPSTLKSDHIVSCIDRSVKLGEIMCGRGASQAACPGNALCDETESSLLAGADYNR